ncbi:CGNR zinc finger domain-containing protein [Herbiconiux liangxiaofengii]|uniref:CGNR zinc finger domain-containing protein n=1 Tax=Herbiconiux liangxiaofengii TaxID=3342795 RepID=UPI0035B7CFDB
MATDATFRFDGGATWLNLLATRGRSFGPHPVERLPTPEAGRRWLALVGFPPREAMTSSELGDLVRLREALRELAMATVAGNEPPPDASAHVRLAASVPGALVSASDGPAERGFTVESALGAIAIQALVTLRGPDRGLLKECAESDCRWVFLDTSGRRHWCPSPACASRGRVRAHRARQAAAPAPVR